MPGSGNHTPGRADPIHETRGTQKPRRGYFAVVWISGQARFFHSSQTANTKAAKMAIMAA